MSVQNVNRVTLLGRIGQDAKLSSTGNNIPFLRFDVATNEEWTDKPTGEQKKITDWHSVVVWGRRAEKLASHFTQGKQVYVEGKQRTREWEKDGSKHRITEVIVDHDGQAFLTGNRAEEARPQTESGRESPPFDAAAYSNMQQSGGAQHE